MGIYFIFSMFEHILTMSSFCRAEYFRITMENELAISMAPVYAPGRLTGPDQTGPICKQSGPEF